jgi:hypothetical protein
MTKEEEAAVLPIPMGNPEKYHSLLFSFYSDPWLHRSTSCSKERLSTGMETSITESLRGSSSMENNAILFLYTFNTLVLKNKLIKVSPWVPGT